MRKYGPNPIDTSDVLLPEELNPLLEAMAKNVHEIWAQERINQGWTYGEKRDDTNKHHPCLVAYEDLPEDEKEFDRNTSVETLKLPLHGQLVAAQHRQPRQRSVPGVSSV